MDVSFVGDATEKELTDMHCLEDLVCLVTHFMTLSVSRNI